MLWFSDWALGSNALKANSYFVTQIKNNRVADNAKKRFFKYLLAKLKYSLQDCVCVYLHVLKLQLECFVNFVFFSEFVTNFRFSVSHSSFRIACFLCVPPFVLSLLSSKISLYMFSVNSVWSCKIVWIIYWVFITRMSLTLHMTIFMPRAERWWHGFSEDGFFLSWDSCLQILVLNCPLNLETGSHFPVQPFITIVVAEALVALSIPCKCQIKVSFISPDSIPTCLGNVCKLLPCCLSLFAPFYTLAFELWQST